MRYLESKGSAILMILATAAYVLSGVPAAASWFLDAERLHASVHGQVSCVECHVAIDKKELHPNPGEVNKAVSDFFSIRQCAGCHDDVIADLKNGVHAGKQVQNHQDYEACITCHDPHYQLSKKSPPAGFDPSKPVSQLCGVCHEQRAKLPAPSSHDKSCMACHRAVATKDAEETKDIEAFCFQCHGDGGSQRERGMLRAFPAINVAAYHSSTHTRLSCLACHPKSAEFGHAGRERTACLNCHRRHDAKVAHGVHLNVSCEACHLSEVIPIRGPQSGKVFWQIDRKLDKPGILHDMTLKHDESSCGRCHHKANRVGAAAMVLPAKSILCMPCHAATFSAADATTIISLLLFLGGMASLCVVWFSGRRSAPADRIAEAEANGGRRVASERAVLSKTLSVAKDIAFDVLLQRRLFRQSRKRWCIHSLIFFPFVFRFFWGITALLTSLWMPESFLPWMLLDKNDPLGAFLFDFSGLMIIAGVVLFALQKTGGRSQDITGLPKQDWAALFLLGSIVVIGFFLEGMRIAMTGFPAGSEYAFPGYALGRLMADSPALTVSYGYVWYLHAIVTGALVAYLPFSSLLHTIMAPVVMVLNAVHRSSQASKLKQPADG